MLNPCFFFYGVRGSAWGIAGANTYRVYGFFQGRDLAVRVWNQINDKCVITAANAASGTHPTKNVTFSSQCNGSGLFNAYMWLPRLLIAIYSFRGRRSHAGKDSHSG